MTIRNFEQQLPPHELTKGKDYFRRKRVTRLKETSGRWTADVKGRDAYEVDIHTSDNSIDKVFCSCVIQEEKIYCKHVIAVLYAIREKLGFAVVDKEDKPAPATPTQASTLEPDVNETLQATVGDALKIKNHKEARKLVEEALQQALTRDDAEEAYVLQKYLLRVMQRGSDITGIRELAQKFYSETGDIDFYGILKETYIRSEWETIAQKRIAALEEKIPLYISGEANPSELADIYLEEYKDGDKLVALMQRVPRLSFINAYSDHLGDGYAPELLGIYRRVLLQQLIGGNTNEEQAQAIKKMETLEGGRMIVRELSGDSWTTEALAEYDVPRYVWEADELLDKANAAMAGDLYTLAAGMALAVVEMKITISGRMKYEHSEFSDRISQGFGLLVTLSGKPVPPELKERLFDLARKKVLDPKYELDNLGHHWLDVLLTLPPTPANHEELLKITDALLAKGPDTRLVLLKKELLDKLGRGEETAPLLWQFPRERALRDQFISEALEANDYARAKELIIEGKQIAEIQKGAVLHSGYGDKLLNLAVTFNDIPIIREIARQAYLATGNIAYYRTLKQTYTEKEWAPVVKTLIAALGKMPGTMDYILSRRNDKEDMAAIYIEEGYADQLLTLAQKTGSLRFIEKYAAWLAPHYPREVVALYKDALATFAKENAHAKGNEDIIQHLKFLRTLPGGKEAAKALIADFKVRFATRTKLIGLLQKVGR